VSWLKDQLRKGLDAAASLDYCRSYIEELEGKFDGLSKTFERIFEKLGATEKERDALREELLARVGKVNAVPAPTPTPTLELIRGITEDCMTELSHCSPFRAWLARELSAGRVYRDESKALKEELAGVVGEACRLREELEVLRVAKKGTCKCKK
jgi:hypothetical protein